MNISFGISEPTDFAIMADIEIKMKICLLY